MRNMKTKCLLAIGTALYIKSNNNKPSGAEWSNTVESLERSEGIFLSGTNPFHSSYLAGNNNDQNIIVMIISYISEVSNRKMYHFQALNGVYLKWWKLRSW